MYQNVCTKERKRTASVDAVANEINTHVQNLIPEALINVFVCA